MSNNDMPTVVSNSMGSINQMQSNLLSSMAYLASNPTFMTPASFLMLQYQMTQLSQLTEAMSNLIAGLNSMISTMIRNLKGG